MHSASIAVVAVDATAGAAGSAAAGLPPLGRDSSLAAAGGGRASRFARLGPSGGSSPSGRLWQRLGARRQRRNLLMAILASVQCMLWMSVAADELVALFQARIGGPAALLPVCTLCPLGAHGSWHLASLAGVYPPALSPASVCAAGHRPHLRHQPGPAGRHGAGLGGGGAGAGGHAEPGAAGAGEPAARCLSAGLGHCCGWRGAVEECPGRGACSRERGRPRTGT